EVLEFWFGSGDDYGRRDKRWFAKDPAFDAELRQRFSPLLEDLLQGKHREWLSDARACLARIVALDQFPRQIHRGSPAAFAADALALQTARHALASRYEHSLLPVERLFMYLPFEHSESLADQERSCELMRPLGQFPETDDALRYAEAHRAIIARFGRFPHRNAILGRASTPEEIEFLEQPGSAF
ncbi:MAG: DUF924 family protein, partial [Rhodospirillaceae bacterium]